MLALVEQSRKAEPMQLIQCSVRIFPEDALRASKCFAMLKRRRLMQEDAMTADNREAPEASSSSYNDGRQH